MSTVAERLREESRKRLQRMTPPERLEEALSLGEDAIEAYSAANDVDLTEAMPRTLRPGPPPAVARDARYHRMSLLSDVVTVLERGDVPHALIGAAAMALPGVSATTDIDVFTVNVQPMKRER